MPSRIQAQKIQDRLVQLGSPGWKSAVDVFKTPKSPSPVKRTTRRSSIYQRKPAKTDITKAKMMVSPPGVKTRARRSSIYQKGGRLLSPGSLPVRTRRTSMYLTTNLQSINEFSKVWATPVKPLQKSPVSKLLAKSAEKKQLTKTPRQQPKSEKKSAKKAQVNQSEEIKAVETPKVTRNTPAAKKPGSKSAKKAKPTQVTPSKEIKAVETPKHTRNTPAAKKSGSKSAKKVKPTQVNESEEIKEVVTPKRTRNTPAANKSGSKSARKARPNQINQSEEIKEVVTPKRTRNTPAAKKSGSKSAKKAKPTQVNQSEEIKAVETPKQTRNTPAVKRSVSKSTKKAKVVQVTQSEEIKKVETPKRARNTPAMKKSAAKTSTPLKVVLADSKMSSKIQKMSSPSKSFEEITGKSFYGTPKHTPIRKLVGQTTLSSNSPKSIQGGKRVSMNVTPNISVKEMKSAKKQYRKTPKPSKRQYADEVDTSPIGLTTKRMKVQLSDTEVTKSSSKAEEKKPAPEKVRLSPREMTSILKSAEEIERMEAEAFSSQMETSPVFNTPGETTPIFTKRRKRVTSRKLAELDMNQSNHPDQSTSEDGWSPNSTLDLNETIYTDSRSSRCTIL